MDVKTSGIANQPAANIGSPPPPPPSVKQIESWSSGAWGTTGIPNPTGLLAGVNAPA